MAKDKITEYDSTANNNTLVGDVNLQESSMLPSDVNNAIREVMSHLKEFSAGTSGVDVLSFQDNDNSHQLKFQAPSSVTTSTTFTLPDGDGSSGQAIVTNGSGTLSFSNSLTNTPSFKAYLSSDQAQTQNSVTQVVYNTEIYDSNSTYDTSNGRFTPAVVGKYFVNASVGIDGADANGRIRVFLYKNGSSYAISSFGIGDTIDDGGVAQCSAIIELDADDYVDARVQYTGTDNVVGQQQKTWFEAFKLAGL